MASDRLARVERWYRLTRETLPEMLARHRWWMQLDRCFMRVCLDAVIGLPWSDVIDRPAVRAMSDAQLAAAIDVAESIVAEPDRLPALNEASLHGRRAARLSAS